MSLFGEYIKETQGKDIIEDENGFATFYPAFNNSYMYIEDIYVKPEKRKSAQASHYADCIAEVARQRGIPKLLGSVNLEIENPTRSVKVLLAYGFKVVETRDNVIYFEKDIR